MKTQCMHKDLIPFDAVDGYLVGILFVVNVLSTVSGAGGGGIIIPILILLGNFGTNYAIPLSSIMVTASTFVRVVFFYFYNKEKHSIVDWDSIMIMIPYIAASSYVGVLINQVAPEYIIIGVLIFFQVLAFALTVYDNSRIASEEVVENNSDPRVYMVIYVIQIGVFIGVVFINLLIKDAMAYYIGKSIFFLLIGIVTSVIVMKKRVDGELVWNGSLLSKYIVVSFCVGILSSFLGLGGGILINPFFIAIGMAPLGASHTTPYIAFYSSLISSIQYIYYGNQILPYYGILFFFEAIVGTLIGIYILERIQNFKIILVVLGIILIVSIVLLIIILVRDV
ncbi:MAG: hypothetical protein Hyperionvirus26_15 [Hyperionvirus sp.]|uniref:Uncharacterized protein n=1 Tax=Hyperionvirus sp. TaxID=2487770 RepID=A0A3G5AB73_9VIRU|nr:MAG: hypothetical protein Hyperionvirus26_15 [Hyperionvirus sp.]